MVWRSPEQWDRMSVPGQKRKQPAFSGMSALPQKQTSSGRLGMSEKCQKRTSLAAPLIRSARA